MLASCFLRSGRQVSSAEEVSASQNDMGRGGDGVLFQRAQQERPEGMLCQEQVSDARREKGACQKDRTHPHAGLQLVQEPPAEGSNASAPIVSRGAIKTIIAQFMYETCTR